MKAFIPRVLNYFGLLSKINISYQVRLNNNYFEVPIINKLGISNLMLTRTWLQDLCVELLKLKNGTIIDVGANIGQTLLLLKSIDRNLSYLGFEPSISCCYYIKELIGINNFPNAIIVPIGLHHKNQINKFFTRSDGDSGATLNENLRPGFFGPDQFQYIPTFSMDHIIQKFDLDSVSIIKIDVETGELEVILGMNETIQKYRPFIVCEVLDFSSDSVSKERQERADQLYDLLVKSDYGILKIIQDENDLIKKIVSIPGFSLKKWTKISRHENDYIFYPSEYHSSLNQIFREL